MPLMLQILAVLVLGLMCGSEFNIGAFAHPAFQRQTLEAHVSLRASFALLFGRIMPFWMSGSVLLNLLLLLPFVHLSPSAWWLAAISFGIQVAAVVFSLVGPVPINKRIARWTAASLPSNWRMQEHRWDLYHSFRTAGLIVAFAILVGSVGLAR